MKSYDNVSEKQMFRDTYEPVKNWLNKYLVKKDDEKNKLGKSYIRSLRDDEKLPRGVYHKAATDNSGILHFNGKDYYWQLDKDDNINVEPYKNH